MEAWLVLSQHRIFYSIVFFSQHRHSKGNFESVFHFENFHRAVFPIPQSTEHTSDLFVFGDANSSMIIDRST